MALITCRECDRRISDTARVCPKCGYDPQAAKERRAARKAKENATAEKTDVFKTLVILLVVSIVAGLLSLLNGAKDASSNGGKPTIGDSGTLRVPSGGDVPVAVSKEAFDRLNQLSIAKDTAGVNQMMLAGLVWTVPSGTKCHVIDSGVFTYEVRISEGKHVGKGCFVASDFIARK